jgi:hypothetical protein
MEHKTTMKAAWPLVLGGSLLLAPALSGREPAAAQTDRDGLVDYLDLEDDNDRVLDIYDMNDRTTRFARTRDDIDGDGIPEQPGPGHRR